MSDSPAIDNGCNAWTCAECGKDMSTSSAAISPNRPGKVFCSARCAQGRKFIRWQHQDAALDSVATENDADRTIDIDGKLVEHYEASITIPVMYDEEWGGLTDTEGFPFTIDRKEALWAACEAYMRVWADQHGVEILDAHSFTATKYRDEDQTNDAGAVVCTVRTTDHYRFGVSWTVDVGHCSSTSDRKTYDEITEGYGWTWSARHEYWRDRLERMRPNRFTPFVPPCACWTIGPGSCELHRTAPLMYPVVRGRATTAEVPARRALAYELAGRMEFAGIPLLPEQVSVIKAWIADGPARVVTEPTAIMAHESNVQGATETFNPFYFGGPNG